MGKTLIMHIGKRNYQSIYVHKLVNNVKHFGSNKINKDYFREEIRQK